MAGIFSMNNLYIYVYLCVFMVLLTNRTVHVDFSSRNFFFKKKLFQKMILE